MTYSKETITKQLDSYQSEINNTLLEMPKEKSSSLYGIRAPILALGSCNIFICSDAYIIGFINGFTSEIKYNFYEYVNSKSIEIWNNNQSDFFTFYEIITKATKLSPGTKININENISNCLIDINIEDETTGVFYPLYSKILIVGIEYFNSTWNSKELAINHINKAFEILNIECKYNAKNLLNTYLILLETAHKEEEVQLFLNQHPEFIYLEYETMLVKPNLGGIYKPDYAFALRHLNGLQWIFVEIEKPSKKIFTMGNKNFQFTSDFTQAKGQLLEWDRYITNNTLYLKNKFQDLFKPKYHLIYGRQSEITVEKREYLTVEFNESNNRIFSTFDDLYYKFNKIADLLNR
ncbi:Shedu anti-phage system protein SduA domain-containing protein [Larkinella humicola]|uniref:DUF4263 domain-containing protein n=1 Tax=Larkinella humicola TaxID=2607654 RepID=A0A5N1JLB2_9BACT|nr:Shedu anti-phage system protein SduA domain-containing protein [Larkinella humicola]KAA9357280.1 DUF4263 domain-containing protein [Larkinella humicola]